MDSESGSDVDMEDVTITRPPAPKEENAMDEDTPVELSMLAASTRITELSYTIIDIQSQLFEIQELRHAEDSGNSGESHLAIERALSDLKEAVALVDTELAEINAALAPVLNQVQTPTAVSQINEHEPVLRKHAALSAEWQAVHQEVSRLHNELQEDQLLVRFRTAVEQAAGMMDSLDKAVEACQEFIWRRSKALRAGMNDSDKPGELWSHFEETVEHYERVKKYYYQSSTQAMASIDKTMGSRDFKNGEVLRRHTELSARWKSIRERITRTDREIEALKKSSDPDLSESGSVRSRTTVSSRAESQSTSMSTSESLSLSTLSQSISPLRKLAAKVTSGFKTPSRKKDKNKEKETVKTAPRPTSLMPPPRMMSPTNPRIFSPPTHRPTAQSIFSTPGHLSSSASLVLRGGNSGPSKPRWNSSTKVQDDIFASAKPSPPRSAGHARHMSASASGRQSAMSGRQTPSRTADYGIFATPRHPQHPPGVRPQTPGSGPRKRPMSPSNIPGPIDIDIGPPSIHKTFATPITPAVPGALSPPKHESPELLTPPKARRASQSRIPAPVFHTSRPTSPSVSTTSYFPDGSASPMSTQFASAVASPVGSSGQSPFNTLGQSAARPPTRAPRAPPSSFRGATPTGRPSSRGSANGDSSGRRTSLDRIAASTAQNGDLTYVPNPKDALDVEVARVANSLAHPYFIERISEFVKGSQGPDASAQYSFTLPTHRKVMVCKLVIVEKSAGRNSIDGASAGGQQRRVICRVGGGWESLSAFLARSA